MHVPPPGEVTAILRKVSSGDVAARGRLAAILYDQLHNLAERQMRGEPWDHTLQPTALVHEAYLRLMGDRSLDFRDRTHFFGAAAEIMRRVLVDHARKRLAAKRGGSLGRESLDDEIAWHFDDAETLIDIDQAMRRLADIDPEKRRIVELRFFAGLSIEEIAAVLESSPRTVKRKWRFARAWLYRAIKGNE